MSNKTYTATDILNEMQRGMSDFQIKNFVVGAQLTPIKQLHQTAMEIDVREETLRKSDFDIKKQELKIKIIEARMAKETDPLLLAELDMEKLLVEEKIVMNLKEQTRLQQELKSFYEVLDYFNQNFELDKMLEMKDTLDVDYWVKRLSRQASLDLIATGRVSNGNMSAMLDMPDEIFQVCVQETYKLTNQLSKVVPMPAISGPGHDEEFLLKFGPTDSLQPSLDKLEQTKEKAE